MTKTITVFFVLLALTSASSLRAATVLPFDAARVLLPITVKDLAGAYGTRWRTELWVRTEASAVVEPLLSPTECDPPCPDPLLIPDDSSYQIDFFRTHPGESDGMLLYVPRTQSDRVHISLRLNDPTGRFGAAPLQLPVVRERQFRTSTVHLLGIPLTTAQRITLRIYGIDPALNGDVRVRAFTENGRTPQAVVLDRIVSLRSTPLAYSFGPYSVDLRPPTATLDLSAQLPGITSNVRLEITPVTPSLAIWAFVSLTDNATQAISLRTPN